MTTANLIRKLRAAEARQDTVAALKIARRIAVSIDRDKRLDAAAKR
jgi:hypothetical protein